MIKKLSDLNKEEKIRLIQALAAGQVDKNCLNADTLVCTEYTDYFLGLMIAASAENEEGKVICLGEAQKAKEAIIKPQK